MPGSFLLSLGVFDMRLSKLQRKILIELRGKDFVSLTALSENVGSLLPSVSRCVKMLEDRGFLKWDSTLNLDHVPKLTLTSKGYHVSEDFLNELADTLPSESVMEKISEKYRALQYKKSGGLVKVDSIKLKNGFDLPDLV